MAYNRFLWALSGGLGAATLGFFVFAIVVADDPGCFRYGPCFGAKDNLELFMPWPLVTASAGIALGLAAALRRPRPDD